MDRRKYFLDFYSLVEQNADIDDWQRNFFWPLAPDWHTRLCKDVERVFKDVVNHFGDSLEGDLLLIAHRLHEFYSILFINLKVVQALDNQEFELICSQQSKILYGILHDDLPQNSRLLDFGLSDMSRLKQISWQVARFRRELVYNFKKPRVLFGELFKGDSALRVVAFPNKHILQRDLMSKIHQYIRFTSSYEWFFNSSCLRPTNIINLGSIFRRLIPEIFNLAGQHSITLNFNMQKYIEAVTREFLSKIATLYVYILGKVKRYKPFHLLSASSGSVVVRALNLAVRRYRGKVTGFHHGYTSVPDIRYYWSLFDLSIVDEFVVYTDIAASHMEYIRDNYPPPRNNKVNIVSGNTDFFLRLWKRKQLIPPPEKIKRVMLIDISLAPERLCRHNAVELAYVNLVLKVAKFLAANGFDVIYKRHPKIFYRRRWHDECFDRLVKTTFRPFEEVMDDTDAYVFFSCQSSIFHYAICTNKPIIFLDNGLEYFFPDTKEALMKRCLFIKTPFDSANRSQLNGNELLGALKEEPRCPNSEYMEKYLFPSKD